jgi:Putative zinc-finger
MTTFPCRQTELLDQLAAGELSLPEAGALKAHLGECAVCRNEFRWLQTEYQIVAQRRDAVLAARARTPLSWRHGIAIAAAAILAVAFAHTRTDLSNGAASHGPFESTEIPVLESRESAPRSCSVLPEGLGFHCSLPVNVVASTDSRF